MCQFMARENALNRNCGTLNILVYLESTISNYIQGGALAMSNFKDFWRLILSLLFVLNVESGIQVLFGASGRSYELPQSFSGWLLLDLDREAYVHFFALGIYLVWLFRFYVGAFRFNQLQAQFANQRGLTLNLIFTLLMFGAFHVASYGVTNIELLFYMIIVIHVIDLLWFWPSLRKQKPHYPALNAARRFLFLSSVTLIIAFLFLGFANPALWNIDQPNSFILFGILFLGIGFFDFWWLWDFYASPAKWEEQGMTRHLKLVDPFLPKIFGGPIGEEQYAFKTLVVIESPYAGNEAEIKKNTLYAQLCMKDCISKGEAPFASHLLYTQPNILFDGDPIERKSGIAAGLRWVENADKTVVYEDLGCTSGMKQGINHAKKYGRPVEFRKLPKEIFDDHFGEDSSES